MANTGNTTVLGGDVVIPDNMRPLIGESMDAMLLRLFREEHQSQLDAGLEPSIESVIMTMCHG